jgi:hypothetical protein
MNPLALLSALTHKTSWPGLGDIDLDSPMDLVEVLECRRNPSENADPCIHPSRTARFGRPPAATHLMDFAQSGPEVRQPPIYPGNPGRA